MTTNILAHRTPEADAAISRFRLQNCSGKKVETANDAWMRDPDSLVGLKSIEEQIHILRKIFPTLGPANRGICTAIANHKATLPWRSTDWFASFHWSKVGATFPEALSRVLNLLSGLYGNRFMDSLGLDNLKEGVRKIASMDLLGQIQGTDILIFPAQFGRLYQFTPVDKSREMMQQEEFGLGIFDVSLMLLVHPERLQYLTRRGMYCAGDEYAPAEVKGEHVPRFKLKYALGADVEIEVDHIPVQQYEEHFGAASGWIMSPEMLHANM